VYRSPGSLFPNLLYIFVCHPCYLTCWYHLPWIDISKSSQLSSIKASGICIRPDKISMKNCNFYKVIQKQFCYIHAFICHMVVFLSATSRANSHPPSNRCHFSREYINLQWCYSVYIWNLSPTNLLRDTSRFLKQKYVVLALLQISVSFNVENFIIRGSFNK
jgi:hypothetical protein